MISKYIHTAFNASVVIAHNSQSYKLHCFVYAGMQGAYPLFEEQKLNNLVPKCTSRKIMTRNCPQIEMSNLLCPNYMDLKHRNYCIAFNFFIIFNFNLDRITQHMTEICKKKGQRNFTLCFWCFIVPKMIGYCRQIKGRSKENEQISIKDS